MFCRSWTCFEFVSFVFVQFLLWSALLLLGFLAENFLLTRWMVFLLAFWIWLVILMHWITTFSNPGIVCLPYSTSKYHPRYCSSCECLKTPSVHHCSQCRVCIQEMDHHCPVIANCVGACNRKKFVLLILYGFCLLFCASGTSSYLWISCLESTGTKQMIWSLECFLFWHISFTVGKLIVIMILTGIVAGLLLHFTVQQLILISLNLTQIEALQMRADIRITKIGCQVFRRPTLKIFFGCYPWDWFWPWD